MTDKIVFTLRINSARSDRHEYLLWVKANEVNYLAVSSQRVQISERRLNICKPSKEYVGNARITSLVGKKPLY